MRKLLSLCTTVFVALTVGACQDQPTTVDQAQPEAGASQTVDGGAAASHGATGVIDASGVYRAVNSTAARDHGLRVGEKVGMLEVTDDGEALSITGEATGLMPGEDQRYVSLFYDKASSVQGPRACEPGRNVGFAPGSDHPLALTLGQMVIGPGTDPHSIVVLGAPHASWNVDSEGNATLGPTSTLEYVPADMIGSVSIRDTEIMGPIGPGTGPDAVVACAKITHNPAR